VDKKSEGPNPMALRHGFDFSTLSRCAASNRSGGQCGQPVVKGKLKCHWHGGKSTGPKTNSGKMRVSRNRSNFRHGEYTKSRLAEIRSIHSLITMAEEIFCS
jgi:hypothetical protein